MKSGSSRKIILFLTITLILFMGATFFLYKYNYLSINSKTKNETTEALELSKKVGKLIVLPGDEVPTIATVTDPEKLKDQTFFAKAKKGDKVLIFSKAKQAILYDPVINKIITMAPLNIDIPNKNPATFEVETSSDTLQEF